MQQRRCAKHSRTIAGRGVRAKANQHAGADPDIAAAGAIEHLHIEDLSIQRLVAGNNRGRLGLQAQPYQALAADPHASLRVQQHRARAAGHVPFGETEHTAIVLAYKRFVAGRPKPVLRIFEQRADFGVLAGAK